MGLVRSQDFHVGKLIACGSFSSRLRVDAVDVELAVDVEILKFYRKLRDKNIVYDTKHQRKNQNQRIHHNSCSCKKNGKEDQNSFDRLVFSCLLFFYQHFCVKITHLLHPPQDIRSVLLHCPRFLY